MNPEFHGVESPWFISVDRDSLMVDERRIKQHYLLGHHSYYLKWIHAQIYFFQLQDILKVALNRLMQNPKKLNRWLRIQMEK